MTDILVATHNGNKRREIRSLLKGFSGVNILMLDDLDVAVPVIVEDGKTFLCNAAKKSRITSKFFNGLVLADDSGLEVDAIGGRPGVRSARFAGDNATDVENNNKLLKLISKIPQKKRRAKFVCHITLSRKGILLADFRGSVKGDILLQPRGKNGFGYDPLFVPDGHRKTFAEMTDSYKNRISHRGRALKKLKKNIGKHLN